MDRPKRTICRKLFHDEDEGSIKVRVSKSVLNANYRAKMMSDPVKATAFKASEAARLRNYRATLPPEMKEEQKAKRRIRDAKKKSEGAPTKKPARKRPVTRASKQEIDDRRHRNKLSQRKRRENMSSQKKRREKERNRDYQRDKAAQRTSRSKPHRKTTEPVPQMTSSACSSAMHRLRKKLGSGKRLLLNIKHLIKSTSRRHAAELQSLGVTYTSPRKRPGSISMDAFLHIFDRLKPLRDKVSLKAKTLLVDVAGSVFDKYFLRHHGLHRSRVEQPYAKIHVSDADKAVVSYFEENSVYLSGKDGVDNKLVAKKILDRSIVQLFRQFVEEHGPVVSRASFFRKRPRNVLSFMKTKYRQCMCDVCMNPMIKMKVLGNLCGCRIESVGELVRLTLCESERMKRVCLMRQCAACGVGGLDGMLCEARLVCGSELEWKRWENVLRRGVSRLELVSKTGTFDEFVLELKCESERLALHDFVHHWQSRQYRTLCKSVPTNWAVLTLDFAENYLCSQQDQPQSAYYRYSQVTVHPCVLYYSCECGDRVTSNVVFLSDDLRHSANMVDAITRKLVASYLPERIQHVVVFSDGCSSQYKSKLPFFFLFNLGRNSSLTFERCYFGSRHGKNPCDALGGVVKRAASRAVLARRAVIQNASDLFSFCRSNLCVGPDLNSSCTHSLRSFELVQDEDLSDMSSSSLQTVPGTRSIHSLRSVENGLLARNLSCFCSACLSGCFKDCPNVEFSGTWRRVKFTKSWLHLVSNHVDDTIPVPPVDDTIPVPPVDGTIHAPLVEGLVPALVEGTVSAPVEGTICAPVDSPVPAPIIDDGPVPAALSASPCVRNTGVSILDCAQLGVSTSTPLFVKGETRESFFLRLSNHMSCCHSYSDLAACVTSFFEVLEDFQLPSQLAYPSILDCGNSVDKSALSLVPEGLASFLYPLLVEGDGNCVPRSISVWAFGTQDRHLEVRCRIVFELVLNSSLYLTLPSEDLETLSLLSDFHCEDLLATYQAEVLDISRPSRFMGMWQLMAACNVFGVPIMSVYPTLGPPAISSFFSRTLQPTNPRSSDCIALLWCSSRDMVQDHWVANHVVPLLHLTTPCAIEFES